MRPYERDRRFVAYLETLARRPGREALAEIAGALGKAPGGSIAALRWLAPWAAGVPERDFALMHLVATLFATHPRHEPGRNFGATMARLAAARGATPSLERRFMALLEAHGEDVGAHLRRAVSLLGRTAVGLDWAQLLADLRGWDDPRRRVQWAWARAFWGAGGQAGLPGREPFPRADGAASSAVD